MYLLLITAGLSLCYVGLLYIVPMSQNTEERFLHKARVRSLVCICALSVLSVLGYYISFMIDDLALSNRFLHAFSGGFVSVVVCFLVAKDAGIKLTRFQFVFFSILIVTTLGVANELVGFFLQNFTTFVAATSINDTWLDLLSNFVGTIVAVSILMPCFGIKQPVLKFNDSL